MHTVLSIHTHAYSTQHTHTCIQYTAYTHMHAVHSIHTHAYSTQHTHTCIQYTAYTHMHTVHSIHTHACCMLIWLCVHKLRMHLASMGALMSYANTMIETNPLESQLYSIAAYVLLPSLVVPLAFVCTKTRHLVSISSNVHKCTHVHLQTNRHRHTHMQTCTHIIQATLILTDTSEW